MRTLDSLSVLLTDGAKAATAYDISMARMEMRAAKAKMQLSLKAAASKRAQKQAMQALKHAPNEDKREG